MRMAWFEGRPLSWMFKGTRELASIYNGLLFLAPTASTHAIFAWDAFLIHGLVPKVYVDFIVVAVPGVEQRRNKFLPVLLYIASSSFLS